MATSGMNRRNRNKSKRSRILIVSHDGPCTDGPYYVPSLMEEIAMTRPSRSINLVMDTSFRGCPLGKLVSLHYLVDEGSVNLGYYKVAGAEHSRDTFGLNRDMTNLLLIWIPRRSEDLDHTFRMLVDDNGGEPLYRMVDVHGDAVESLFDGTVFRCVGNRLVPVDVSMETT